MARLQACFESLESKNRKALLPYIVAGDPDKGSTVAFMHGMVESGADIIELGVPFSDPMADGPSNQLGHERALKNNTSSKDVLDIVKLFREKNSETPVVLMGYLNPVEIYGYERFAKDAAESGVDGLLIVDLPPEESHDLKSELVKNKLDLIFLLAPTTSDERIKLIAEHASGYLYYVSLKGVTGAANLDLASVQQKISDIRKCTSLPITVGFGIKDPDTAASVSKLADGVVVGSVLVDQCDKKNPAEKLNKVIGEMRKAMEA